MTKSAHRESETMPADEIPADVSDTEKRWEMRRPTKFPGVISTGKNSVSFKCSVSDTSSTGAKLEVDTRNPAAVHGLKELKGAFWLFMPFDRTIVRCEIAWRDGARVGVRFVSQMQTRPPEPKRSVKVDSASKSGRGWLFRKAN